jgi:hypothetical protein
MNLRYIQHRAGTFIGDNSPTILSGLGVAGLVATAYLTGKASFRAHELINDEEFVITTDNNYQISGKEKFELCWKLYIPAAVAGSLSVMAIIGANRIGTRRAAAMTAAYAISERAYEEYKSKVVDHIGAAKEKKLRDEIASERVSRHPLGDQQAIDTGGGKDLCYDIWNGRYFWGSMEAIKQAQNRVNYKINHHFYASLTDFYDYLGLDKTKTSDDLGWGQSDQLELTFSTTVSDKGQPVLVMDFLVDPSGRYERLY